jgi:hypothetical protein
MWAFMILPREFFKIESNFRIICEIRTDMDYNPWEGRTHWNPYSILEMT